MENRSRKAVRNPRRILESVSGIIVLIALVFNTISPVEASASSLASQPQQPQGEDTSLGSQILKLLGYPNLLPQPSAAIAPTATPTVDTAIPPTDTPATPAAPIAPTITPTVSAPGASPSPTTGAIAAAPAPALSPEDTPTAAPATASPTSGAPADTSTSTAAAPDDTPTAGPATASPTAAAPTSTLMPTAATGTAIDTSTPTSAASATPSATPSSTASPTATSQPPLLSFNLSVSPQQAAPGDTVLFTIQITNNGNTEATGLKYSDTLPQAFGSAQDGFKGFSFDAPTRLLTWNGAPSSNNPAQANQSTLPAGQALTLQYSVRLDPKMKDEQQIVDSALLTADGLAAPLTSQAALTVLTADKQLSALDLKGGTAQGLNGHVQVSVPVGALASPEAILIQDLNSTNQAPGQSPWFNFRLDLRNTQSQISQAEPNEQDSVISLSAATAKFKAPVQVTVSFQGVADLASLPADQTPYLVTLDETTNTWIQVPLKSIDRNADTITADTNHFSVWGAGIGPSGSNVLGFDQAYPDLFAGRSRTSLPIWTPPGRNGMAPSLMLSYSSATADGILGDIQAPWVGMGWNIDTVEISRQNTDGNCSPCGGSSYGYVNKFLLLFNGTGYNLIADGTTPGRYHTQPESFLYIQLHNDALGNNSPAAANAGGEWWEVVERDGTRWRLGWNADSEQLAAMKGYACTTGSPCTTPNGGYASLGYAGHATDVVAWRWRADLVTDTHGNNMSFSYFKESRLVAGSSASYDRASYIDTILYTGGGLAAGYSVHFLRQSRTAEIPSAPADWENWDTYLLQEIDVKYGSTLERSYGLGYQVNSYTDPNSGQTWQTTVLNSLATSGGGTSIPTMTFNYINENNRAGCGTGCAVWAYPRLSSIANGWGGTASYTYANDGRAGTSWYNWNVASMSVADGVNTSPMTTAFSYSAPCYNDTTAGWCNTGSIGELIGYGQTSAATKDFNGTTTLASSVHSFYTDQQKVGSEYQTQYLNGSGTILRQTNTAYTVVTTGLPAGDYFTYASQVQEYLLAAGLTMVNQKNFTYDTTTGNLTLEQDYTGTATLYRQIEDDYLTNTSPSVWILDKAWQHLVKDASGTIISEQQFGYDSNLPDQGTLTKGELSLSRQVDVTNNRTVDTGYKYDTYGNRTETDVYQSYSTPGSSPAGAIYKYLSSFDAALGTYVTSTTDPLNHTTSTNYNYGLGLPTSVTDINNNTTNTAYDGLGRVTDVTYPGYAQPNIHYTYPAAPTAPFAVQMDSWNGTTAISNWQIYDGLGRVIQTQGPYQTAGTLILADTSFNAMGLAQNQGLPRTQSGSGGSYYAPSWGSLPHNSISYDALGRTTSTTYPDGSHESYVFSGLSTTAIDRNNHQKIQVSDSFGRLVQVQEYTGTSSYTLYATTNYGYDERDLITSVTDAAYNSTSISYDAFGRKTSMTDPDMGAWGYQYDVFGNMHIQTDARGCTVTVAYDAINRPTGKTYAGAGACASTPAVTYSYDSTTGGNQGIGHRTGMSDGSGTTTWVYNALGQMTAETRTVDGNPYTSNYTYDAFGRPTTQNLPSGEALTYSYNTMGSLSGLNGTSSYVSQVNYTASGQVTDQHLGNGITQQSCYDANTLRVTAIRVYSGTLQACGTTPTSPALNLTYTYRPNGNIDQMTDATRSETVNYTYDSRDRLLNTSGAYNMTYTYNRLGNLMSAGTTTTPTTITAGYFHACVVTTLGALLCWGRNANGQLGVGDTTQRAVPVTVSGMSSGVAGVAAGNFHTCAVTTSGGVKCWGYNTSGQLGDGTTTQRTTPVDVSGLTSGVTAITAGQYHSCALLTSGGVKCWGDNTDGQLGDGTTTNRSTPVSVSGLSSGVIAISAGGFHTCALLSTGAVKCWGYNNRGQLGDGTTTQRNTPVSVSGLSSGVTSISAGRYHTCAVVGGGAKCWGRNDTGQVGDGTVTDRSTPVSVSGLTSGVSAIEGASAHTCALTTSGGAKCWGFNTDGELGNGGTTQQNTPVDVSGLTSGVSSISSGGLLFTCAITTGGLVDCWGKNDYYQLGTTSVTFSATALQVIFPTAYTYGDAAHAHAVTSLNTGESYTYDADGNMISRVEGGATYTQTFNGENRLVSVLVQILHQADQTTQFVYDGDGNLIKQINQDGSKTIYIDGFYEADRSSGGSLTNTRVYYPAGGAMRVNGVLYYDLRDNLGSAAAVMDSSGNIVGQERYYPFGGTRVTTGTVNTDRLYTGQRSLASLGLMDYKARFYEPTLGVFIQPDTMMPSAANPQSLNRYSYVLNDPINLNDPSGYKPCWATKNYTCNNLTKKLANQQYSLYSSADQPAVAAFFASQGIIVGNSGGGGGGVGRDTCAACGPGLGGATLNGLGSGFGGGNGGGDNWQADNGGITWSVPAGAGFSPTQPGWHNYPAGPNPVCAAAWNCTQSQIVNYFSRFAYPGQDPSTLVVNGGRYSVDVPDTNISMRRFGRFQTFVLPGGLTSYNLTLKSHIFYNGIVIRTVFQGVDGGWYLETHGYGNNQYPDMNKLNQATGTEIFNSLDQQMLYFVMGARDPLHSH
jgi:RHS repeat-associated protein/uncharacterized repeat protein (TIGR01451 family)